MTDRKQILGVDIDDIDMESAYTAFVSFIKGNKLRKVYTPNPEFLLNARKDIAFRDILNSGDLVLPDGIGVIICSRILNRPIRQRVRGVDFVKRCLDGSKDHPFSIFLLGASSENCRLAAKSISRDYPGVRVLGYQDGYYKKSDENLIVKTISALSPDLLLVALGSPRQEKFIEKYSNELSNVKCAIGVGGTIDILSGTVRLAPPVIRKAGVEWLYRLIKEPRRFMRIARLPVVILYAISQRIRGRKTLK